MSAPDLERDDELDALLSGERPIPRATPGQHERVWRNLELLIPDLANTPSEGADTAPRTPEAPRTHPTPAASTLVAKATLAGISAIVGGTLALGVERIVVDHQEVQPSSVVAAPQETVPQRANSPEDPVVDAATPMPPSATESPTGEISRPTRAARPVQAETPQPSSEEPAPTETTSAPILREEQSWIATMRAGLLRHEWDEVERRALAYRAQFPFGQLREDCDALALIAALSATPPRATETEVNRFYARFPNSLYRGAIERARRAAAQ